VDELRERDERDLKRSVAPLKPATDAISIDTDPLTIEQVVSRIMIEIKNKGIT
jgi:cytidylate kinase